MVKKLWQYVKPFSSDTGPIRTDRRTDGQTDGQADRIAISILRVSVLTRDKKWGHFLIVFHETRRWNDWNQQGSESTIHFGSDPADRINPPPADHFWLRQPKLKRSDTFGVISGMLSQSAVYFTFFHHSFPRFYAVICFLFVLLSGVIFVITARRVCIARTMPSQDVCLFVNFVRPSHAGIVSKRLHIYSDFCLPSGSPTILVFPHQTGWQYSGGDLTGAWNAKVYEKITIFDQYMALSRKWRKIEP